MTTPPRRPARVLVAASLAVLALSACTGAAPGNGAGPSAGPPEQPSAQPPAESPIGGGAGSDGSPGSGIGISPPVAADPVDPGAGQAKLVVPRPGQGNPLPVAPIKLEVSIDGRHVLVKVSWYSGVEPCSVLDSVKVERTGSDIAITPFEGTGDPNAICIEIAVLKATIVDLGDLEPGTYRLVAPTGDAPAVEVAIR
jgi:hypothetical protein